ncbi:MAG: acyltransferase family protein [Candidatus Nanopelagicales bacterium]
MSASPVAHAHRSAVSSRTRIAAIDNAKVLLVLLVVIGHALMPSTGESVALADTLYLWIFLFHMPAFAFVMGHVSRVASRAANDPVRLVTRLLIPYLVFNALFIALDQILPGRESAVDLTVPYWLTWFLLSVFWWRLLLPVITQLRYPVLVSVVISLVSGLAPAVDETFAASRTLALLPFFVLGATLRTDQVLWRGRKVGRAAGLVVLAAAGFAAWQLREVITSAPSWLYWNDGYNSQGLDLLSGMAVRGLMLAIGILLTCSFLLVIPRARTGYTALGGFIVYAYLLHGPIIQVYRQTPIPDLVSSWWAVLIVVFAAAALAIGCMHPTTRRYARPLVQPRVDRLFKSPRAGRHQPTPDATPQQPIPERELIGRN